MGQIYINFISSHTHAWDLNFRIVQKKVYIYYLSSYRTQCFTLCSKIFYCLHAFDNAKIWESSVSVIFLKTHKRTTAIDAQIITKYFYVTRLTQSEERTYTFDSFNIFDVFGPSHSRHMYRSKVLDGTNLYKLHITAKLWEWYPSRIEQIFFSFACVRVHRIRRDL